MKNYHFDLGDTTEGCVGLCARVVANSEEEAVRLLKDAFENSALIDASVERDAQCQGTVALHLRAKEIEYVHVYLNFDNLSPHDIDDVEEVD
jgi:hypothetical protein